MSSETIRTASELFFSYCEIQQRMSKHTLSAYRQDLRYFAAFLDQLEPPVVLCPQWTVTISSLYRFHLEDDYVAATIKRRISSLHTFAAYLMKESILTRSPFEEFVLRPRRGVLHISMLTHSEILRVRTAMHANPYADWAYLYIKQARDGYGLPTGNQISREVTWVRDLAILDLIFCFHLTVKDLRGLLVEDFDSPNRTLKIRNANGEDRSILLGTGDGYWSLFDYNLLRIQIHVDTPHLFISKFQTPMSVQGIRNLFNKYIRMAKEKTPKLPSARQHVFVHLLRESGLHIQHLEDQLGRGSISVLPTSLSSPPSNQEP